VSPRPKARPADPELFLDRERSWLAFNERVLEEAADPSTPLLERVKFATIVASNLDEFFMVRVAARKLAVREGTPEPSGLTPAQQLAGIAEAAHAQTRSLYATVHDALLPALAERGVRFLALGALEEERRAFFSRHFREQIFPALTPLAIDSSRPLPQLANLSLNLALLLAPAEGGEEPRLAVVQVPARLPRLLRSADGQGMEFVWVEDVIRAELGSLFPGQQILDSFGFRIARDASLELDGDDSGDFRETVETEVRKRRGRPVVRLEVDATASPSSVRLLAERLSVEQEEDVYPVPPPLDLRALQFLLELPALQDLRDPPWRPVPFPGLPDSADLFSVLEARDVLLHHPYDAFDPVVHFVEQAARDPDVLAIKQTLYRTSGDSRIVRALAEAAERGRQVTVLVELTARFDEESNIRWTRRLEEAGAHVIYGVRGFKTHAKLCLVVRRTEHGIRRYVHLGTGNYNERTARLYTDMGLLTADEDIGQDASAFFNALTGYADPPQMKKLCMAPTQLRQRFLDLIRREQRRAAAGETAEIRAKMNSLVDEEIVRALAEASAAGVRIRLNVRGICCLRPGTRKSAGRIEVVSVVDRFLEHARIYHFRNGGEEEVYLSSADWMPRNLDRRVELLFPVESPDCRRKVLRALDAMFLDTSKAHVLQPDGGYRRRKPAHGEDPVRAQTLLCEEAAKEPDRARAAAALVLQPLTTPPETARRA
jgi:polyphosphate kinase